MVGIWQKVDQEEWLILLERQLADLHERCKQAEDIALRILSQSESFLEVMDDEAYEMQYQQEQFEQLEMPFIGVNFLMVINLYNRLEYLQTLVNTSLNSNKAFIKLQESLQYSYKKLIENIEKTILPSCPLYLYSSDIKNAIIVDKGELQRYRRPFVQTEKINNIEG